MGRKLIEIIKQALCEHDFHTLYLDAKFHTERGESVRYWVCGCKKCGKRIRIESKKTVL